MSLSQPTSSPLTLPPIGRRQIRAADGQHRQPLAATAKRPGKQDVLAPANASATAPYVTIPLAAALTGYSAKAIRRKIECGVWLEGREFRKAPDGHVLISIKGYQQWVERGRV
jgi:hypothetical protein